MGFTYKGIHSSTYFGIKEDTTGILPPIDTVIQDNPARLGGIYVSSSFGPKTHEFEIILNKAASAGDIPATKRNIAAWLRPDTGPGPLVLDDEPDKTYTAILDGDTELQTILKYGFGSIRFVSPSPVALSSETTNDAQKSLALFKRNGVAYDAAGERKLIDVARYQTARFGQGILIEEAKTNLLPDSDFSTGLAGIDALGAVLIVDNAGRRPGTRALQMNDTTELEENHARWTVPVTAGTRYTFSAYAMMLMGTQQLIIDWLDANGNRLYLEMLDVSNTSWQRVSFSRWAPEGVANARLWIYSDLANIANGLYCDLQFEVGSLSSWTLTERAAERLTIDVTDILLGESQGTIMFVANVGEFSRWHYLIDSNGANRHLVAIDSGRTMHIFFNDVSMFEIPNVPIGPQRIAYTWNGQTARVFINGVQQAQYTYDWPISFADVSTLWIGSNKNTAEHWNGYIDDLVISPRAWTQSEIAAQTNATANVQAGDYKFSFDNTLTYTSGESGFNVSGNIEALPIITVEITKQINTLQLDHLQTGRFVRIDRPLGIGDVLIIDSEKRTVKINGIVDMRNLNLFSQFFDFPPGINQVVISPGDSVNATITYKARWL